MGACIPLVALLLATTALTIPYSSMNPSGSSMVMIQTKKMTNYHKFFILHSSFFFFLPIFAPSISQKQR